MMNQMHTVNDPDGVPALLIIRERNEVLICDSNNLHRNLKVPMTVMGTLLAALGNLQPAAEVRSRKDSRNR